MSRKALWVEGRLYSRVGEGKAQIHHSRQIAYGVVGFDIQWMSGVANSFISSLRPLEEHSRLQQMAAQLHVREGVRRDNNVAQPDATTSQTLPGAAKWSQAPKIIKQNRHPSHQVVRWIQLRRQNTESLKVELERVKVTKANATRRISANGALGIREPEPISRVEEEQSPPISEGEVTEKLGRQRLIRAALLLKVHWMKGRSTPGWITEGLHLSGQCGLQSRARNDWSQNRAQCNYSTEMHSVETASQAIAVLQNRLQRSITTDSLTYVKLLQMCSKQKDLTATKELHEHILRRGIDKNKFVAVTLLDVYIKCGALWDARRVFDQLEEKSVVTWTNMIGGYAKSEDAKCAMELFNQMRQECVEPNEVTYLTILKACGNPLALKWGKVVHLYIRQAGFESDVRVATALLKMYAKCGSLNDARLVFDRMEKRDVFTWTAVIGGYADEGHGAEAYRLFLQMEKEGFKPDAITYISILNGSASAGALEWMKEVHDHASKAGLESDLRVGNALVHMYAQSGSIDDARLVFDRMEKRDVVTWTAMIGGYADAGNGVEAYRLFLQMRREGFRPNAITYASILNTSASAGSLQWAKEVHGHAIKAGLESTLRVGNALVNIYAKSGSIADARLVFDRMEQRDVVTWNTMIGGLALHGRANEALELFREMSADGVNPDGTSFVVMLSACCHGGLVNEGRRLFSAMTKNHDIEPETVHYSCMVNLLGRAGYLEEAELFISDMPVEPNAVTWRALLGACRTHGDVELGEFTANELFKLEPNDGAAYVLLSNIYAAGGRWEKVSLVRTMMQERGVRKEPGCSWIEVDSKVHEFVVGDTSHPEAKAIYTELNKLTDKLKAEGYIPDTRLVLHDINEEDKELALCSHSEKLAIAYGLIHIPREEPIRVTKNLRVCPDCHTVTKLISKVTGREIIARDANRFHHFKDGMCTCGDYW